MEQGKGVYLFLPRNSPYSNPISVHHHHPPTETRDSSRRSVGDIAFFDAIPYHSSSLVERFPPARRDDDNAQAAAGERTRSICPLDSMTFSSVPTPCSSSLIARVRSVWLFVDSRSKRGDKRKLETSSPPDQGGAHDRDGGEDDNPKRSKQSRSHTSQRAPQCKSMH